MTTMHASDGYTRETSDSDEVPELRAATPLTTPEQRFTSAMACLGAAYALSWTEFALMLAIGLPGDASSHPLAASVASRVLVGLLYVCAASRLQWARWVTVVLGFVSVALVAPTIGLQWHVFPAGAFVVGAGLVCKFAASLYLLSPMPPRTLKQ
ncbi:hypothetical protein AWB79_04994 [Caballeronia hypogeia]|uniref:Uncharacterized protein n=1 Tax=Caballeronia hypogeia TaxID=1777140 RepID=A0A158C9S3_9BURK|nr:hypothetical protein [Caballeronia hypogeia]SAK79031.1 hypothetical protein AWB79_04994 [Caballeronia hypogeia]